MALVHPAVLVPSVLPMLVPLDPRSLRAPRLLELPRRSRAMRTLAA